MMQSELSGLVGGLRFTESPRWRDGALWFVDVLAQRVYSVDESGENLRVRATVAGGPGGLGFMPDGTPLVVSAADAQVKIIGPDGSLRNHADLSAFVRGAANDMLIDDHGRAYVGHYGYDLLAGADFRPASLLMIEPDGSVSEVADSLAFPNGMGLAADGNSLIVAETFANQLSAFDVNTDGTLANRRIWAPLPDLSPDGICVAPDGTVWVGCAYAGRFVRVEEGGLIVDHIDATGKWAIACTLGGADGDTLFCMTAKTSFEAFGRGESEGFVDFARLNGG